MKANPLVLLVGDTPRELDFALETLQQRCPLRVVRVERPATACARICGGGVDAVLLQAPPLAGSAMEDIAMMHRAGPEIPILAVYGHGDERAGEAAVRAGAAASLPIFRCAAELGVFLGSALAGPKTGPNAGPNAGPKETERSDALPSRARAGTVLAFLGAKGGVGATTVALNAAALLARENRVILVELRPQLGTLYHYFRTRPAPRDLSSLLAAEPSRKGIADVHACLWQSPVVHGLRVLFGPQSVDEPRALTAAHVRVILDCAAQLADYVVLDLPPSCGEANRAAIQLSELVALVLERDPICLISAKAMLETLEKWNILPERAGTVIVNRVALAAPFDLPEAEARLGIPLLAVIPPSPELCLVARQALKPLVDFDPESLAAGGFGQLLPHLSIRVTAGSTPRG